MIENRLEELIEIIEMTKQDFADSVNIELGTLNTYISTGSNSRDLPVNIAIRIANKYHTTLDWIYGNSSFLTEQDSRLALLFSLRKVFQIANHKYVDRRSKEIHNEPVLLIDRNFRDFLSDIKDLEADRLVKKYNEQEYEDRLDILFDKYCVYFKNIFDREMELDADSANLLFGVEDDDISDPLNFI